MSVPDVYEFLGRLADTDHRAEPVDTGFYQFPDPVASAFEHAQHVVEFLRWRSAREEWPSDGCFCYVVIQFGSEPFESGWLELRRGGFRNMKKVLVHDGPLSVTRWRYALGPCSCSAVADPAKEGSENG